MNSMRACCVIVLFAAGCGNPACSVSGTVNYDGQLIAEGSITFHPADGKGPTSAAEIRSGRYIIAEIVPGPKIVAVTAVKTVPFARSSEEMAKRAAEQKAKGNATGIIDPADTVPATAPGNNSTHDVKPGKNEINIDIRKK